MGENGSPVLFLLALSLVEWVSNPLLSTIRPRLLAILWSRDGLFSPPVLFGSSDKSRYSSVVASVGRSELDRRTGDDHVRSHHI